MCDSGHSEAKEDVRAALQRLEEALARHEEQAASATASGEDSDPSLQVLQRSVVLMRQEADRLRALLDTA